MLVKKSAFYISWHYCKSKAGKTCVKPQLSIAKAWIYQLLFSDEDTGIISVT